MPGISSGWILTHSSCRCSDVSTSLIMLAMKQNHMMLFQLFINLSIHINHDDCCCLRCCHYFGRFFVDISILDFKVTSVVVSMPGWIPFVCDSWFSQTHKIANIGIIANFVSPHICSFLLYLQYIMLVNIKLDICGYKLIRFQGCRLHWSDLFLMAQLKRSWQYWHSCIMQSL